jgi:hypothetical protein
LGVRRCDPLQGREIEAFPAAAGNEFAIFHNEPVPPECAFQHHQGRTVAYGYTRIDAREAQLLGPMLEIAVEVTCEAQGAHQMAACETLERWMGAIEDDHTEWCEKLRESTGEAPRHGGSRTIVPAQPVESGILEFSCRQIGCETLQRLLRLRAK